MKHLGDITKIHGYDVPRTEVVIGGSPCQDLSVAGLKAGLGGERSGLFMEQIRIIKEMRARDEADGRTDTDVYPRFMVWENVPGAFSSNKGEDFRTVLEETVRIAEPTAVIPRYEGGRWTNAGVIIGNGFSVGWRTHDAQYWGVPQRRKRISLVADFGGLAAPEILFERKSLSRDTEPGGEARQETAGDTGNRAETARTFNNTGRGWWNESDIGATLRTPRGGDAVKANLVCIPEISRTLSARYDSSPCVDRGQEFVCIPINTMCATHIGTEKSTAPFGVGKDGDPQFVLQNKHHHAVFCIQGNCIDRADTAGCNGKGWNDEDVSYTLNTVDRPAVVAPQTTSDQEVILFEPRSQDGVPRIHGEIAPTMNTAQGGQRQPCI